MSGPPAPSAVLSDLDRRLRPLALAEQRTLPVADVFDRLLPGGLPRGVTVTVDGPAARSFAFALLAAASRSGEWLAVIGLAGLGWGAVTELGVVPTRIVTVDPEHAADRAGDVVAAALDGFALTVIGPRTSLSRATQRRLAARARERSAVLISVHDPEPGDRLVGGTSARCFADIADLRVDTRDGHWRGLDTGTGYLAGRRVAVTVEGKRLPGRRRSDRLLLPDAAGGVTPAGDGTVSTPIVLAGGTTAAFPDRHRPDPARPA